MSDPSSVTPGLEPHWLVSRCPNLVSRTPGPQDRHVGQGRREKNKHLGWAARFHLGTLIPRTLRQGGGPADTHYAGHTEALQQRNLTSTQ